METMSYSKAVSPSSILECDHARLEALCDELLEAYKQDDWALVRAAWGRLERGLIAHLDSEERWLLPLFAVVEPAEARALRGEHNDLRRRVDDMGIGIDLHCTSDAAARDFIERLRAHAEREDRTLYWWADQRLDPRVVQALRARLEKRGLDSLQCAAEHAPR
jgi:hypothetical protein